MKQLERIIISKKVLWLKIFKKNSKFKISCEKVEIKSLRFIDSMFKEVKKTNRLNFNEPFCWVLIIIIIIMAVSSFKSGKITTFLRTLANNINVCLESQTLLRRFSKRDRKKNNPRVQWWFGKCWFYSPPWLSAVG